MNNYLVLDQRTILSQSQIQSLQVLEMDVISLNEMLYNEYLENPVLDYQGSGGESIESLTERMQASLYAGEGLSSYGGGEEGEGAYEIPDRKGGSVQEHVMSQIRQSDHSGSELELARYLTELLDEDGYLVMSASEIADHLHAGQGEVEKCLDMLRRLEPCGIFSETLQECLIRQLDRNGDLDEYSAAIVRDHLDDIAEGRVKNITRSLRISTAEARRYISLIRNLNPRPLAGMHPGVTEYIVPDILVERRPEGWQVLLNDSWVEDYRISDYYLRMMESTRDQELREYFQERLERARLLMRNVSQRRSTMMAIANAVLDMQREYFEGGKSPGPMTMQEVADRIGMHTSTVSRGIRNKYIQSPRETIPMKNLFSAQVSAGENGEGEGLSAVQIQDRIRSIIAGETADAPLSDQKIADCLREEGISVSRRTIAKYRDIMNIPGMFQRRV